MTWDQVWIQQYILHHHDRQPLLLLLSRFSKHPHLDTTGLLCLDAQYSVQVLELVNSARVENQAPAFCHFSIKNKVSGASDTHYMTNLSKVFTIIFESSPLLAIGKTSSRESTSQNTISNNLTLYRVQMQKKLKKEVTHVGKRHFREKWIQQTWGTCMLSKKSLCIT